MTARIAPTPITFDFDRAFPDVVALAFDPSSHWLACLATDGTIEVVPVP